MDRNELLNAMAEANKTIVTTDIKGKDYAMVNQRIKAFRMVHPNGSIVTDILSLVNGVVTMRTTVSDESGKIIATGMAYEKEDANPVNKTSFIENCETSSVGRALGMAGYGIDVAVASAEEVKQAIEKQEPKAEPKLSPAQKALIARLYNTEELKAMNLEELTKEEASRLIQARKK